MKLGWKNFFLLFHIFGMIVPTYPNYFSEGLKPPTRFAISIFWIPSCPINTWCLFLYPLFLCWWYARQKFCAAILSEIEIPTLLILQSFLWLLTQISSCLWCHVNITQFFQSTTQYYYPFFPVGFLDLDGFIEVIGQSLSKHHWPILE